MIEILKIVGHYPGNCRPTQIEPLGNAGGMSGAQFWRLTSPRGTLVLRRWPREHPTPERLRFIHAVLQHASRRGITFVPVPVRTIAGESFVEDAGYLWELARWMPGAADYEHDPSGAKLRSAMQSLAKLHNALVDFEASLLPCARVAPSPAINRRLAMLHGLASGGIEALSRAVTDSVWPDLAPLARRFVTTLPSATRRAIAQLGPLSDAPLALQPCVRDIWHDHVLFTGDEVTGIIDFGAVGIDTPACDVARMLGSLAGDDTTQRQAGLAAYSSIRPIAPVESQAIAAFDVSGSVLAGCNWLRWIYIDGRSFENPTQIVERFRKIVARIES